MEYKIFIDDSGNKEYKTPYARDFVTAPPPFEEYQQFWRDNYFVLCGVCIPLTEIAKINEAVNNLKLEKFGTKAIEIKSEWLRNPNQRNKYYIKKYNLTIEKLTDFVETLYAYLQQAKTEIKLLATVFDKRCYGDAKRKTNEGSPLLKCVQVLFERLQFSGNIYNVIFDQFEDHLRIEKGQHKKILSVARNEREFDRIYVEQLDCITGVGFSKSKFENFLQIADLCAYNIYRQFVHYGRIWTGEEGDKQQMPTYDYFEKIRHNFLCHRYTGRVQGCGLICIPDPGKQNWNVLGGEEAKK